jgi:hypothetical protein
MGGNEAVYRSARRVRDEFIHLSRSLGLTRRWMARTILCHGSPMYQKLGRVGCDNWITTDNTGRNTSYHPTDLLPYYYDCSETDIRRADFGQVFDRAAVASQRNLIFR